MMVEKGVFWHEMEFNSIGWGGVGRVPNYSRVLRLLNIMRHEDTSVKLVEVGIVFC